MNVRRSRLAAGVFVSLGACAFLSGCVGNPFADAKVDPRSPIAAEVASSVRPDAPYPTFRGIPPLPKDVRPHRQYGVQAAAIEKQAADLAAETSDSTWTLRHTDAFAAQARSDAGPELSSDQLSDTEAFAKGAKARATPPPPRPK